MNLKSLFLEMRMSLKRWIDNGWLRRHQTSSKEIFERNLQHYRTIHALPLILGQDRKKDSDYLDTCRSKRNIVEYDYVGGATEEDAIELIEFVIELKEDVLNWLKKHHPNLGKDL